MDLQVAGNTALVTASSSGLGKGSARALCREGANVVICGRDAERLAAAERDLESIGGDSGAVTAVQADLTERSEVESLVSTAATTYGGIDHVVTSAGGPPSGRFLSMDDPDWYAAFDQLVMSVVWTLRAAHPHLAESDDGSVVAITSTSVREAIDGLVLSNSVRRSVLGIVKTLSREWGPDVRVNAVLPGTHETARIEELIEQGIERGKYDDYEEGLADKAAGKPLDELGDPDAFGDAVAFLASPRAEFVTGAELPLDGGGLRS